MLGLIIFFAILIAVSAGLFVFLQGKEKRARLSSSDELNRRIAVLQDGMQDQGALESRAPNESFFDKLSHDLAGFITGFSPSPSKDQINMLNKAGYRTNDAHVWFFFQQVSGAITGVCLGILTVVLGLGLMAGLAVGLLLGLLFYMAPMSSMRNTIQDRTKKIDKTLPDMIDLFANCCMAGVSIDIAAGYILNDLGNDEVLQPIKEDLLAWQSDVNLGVDRPKAWQRLAERSDSKNIKYFTSLINQSEKTGGSISEALFKMSDFFRERRKQMIESEIAQLPTKMSTQTIFFIVMPIVVMLMFPVFLHAYKMASELF
ncbi:MAG TPA: type II secretion system F family protein [Vampirovibrionales bacterium]